MSYRQSIILQRCDCPGGARGSFYAAVLILGNKMALGCFMRKRDDGCSSLRWAFEPSEIAICLSSQHQVTVLACARSSTLSKCMTSETLSSSSRRSTSRDFRADSSPRRHQLTIAKVCLTQLLYRLAYIASFKGRWRLCLTGVVPGCDFSLLGHCATLYLIAGTVY